MKRTFKKEHKRTCSKDGCDNILQSDRELKQRYCNCCHAEYMRRWRSENQFSLSEIKKCFIDNEEISFTVLKNRLSELA